MKLMILICVIQLFVQIGASLLLGINIRQGFRKFFGLESSYKLNSWNYATFNAVLMTFILTRFCMRIRSMIITENYKKFRVNEKKKDIKRSTWHQLRTLEIKGGIESDFPGNVLKEIIRKLMEKKKIKGKLLSIKAVPSLEKVVELEKKREEMLMKFKLKKSLKCSWLRTCCKKKYLYDPRAMNKQLLDYNRSIKKELRNIKCSSHLFLFFDTPKAACDVCNYITANPQIDIDDLYSIDKGHQGDIDMSFVIKENLASNQDPRIYDYDRQKLKVTYMPHIIDILWRNMYPHDVKNKVRKCMIYFALFIMLIFVSTPAAMLQGLRKSSGAMNYILTFKFLITLPEGISIFLRDYFTTLIISGLNALASELIDYLSSWQYFVRISVYHSFVLTNMVVYFTVNMILMPGITLSTDNTIYKGFTSNTDSSGFSFKDFIETFYLKDSGEFFLILILQKASLSFANTFLRLPDLSKFFTLTAATKYRTMLRTNLHYKNEFDTFPYGYYYGMNITIINIIGLFGPYVPCLTLAGIFYFFFRLVNDGVAMLCIYDRDIEGNGVMTFHAVRYSFLGVIMSHLFLIVSCYVRNEWMAVVVNLLCLVFSFYMYFVFSKTPLNFDNIIEMCRDIKYQEPKQQDIESWITHYTHPIMKMTKYFYAYKKNFDSPKLQPDQSKLDIKTSVHQSRIPTEGREEEEDDYDSGIASSDISNSQDHNLNVRGPKSILKNRLEVPETNMEMYIQKGSELQELGRRLAGDSMYQLSDRKQLSSNRGSARVERKNNTHFDLSRNSKRSKTASSMMKKTPMSQRKAKQPLKQSTFGFKDEDIPKMESFDEDSIKFHFYSPKAANKGMKKGSKTNIQNHLSMDKSEFNQLFGTNGTIGMKSPGSDSDFTAHRANIDDIEVELKQHKRSNLKSKSNFNNELPQLNIMRQSSVSHNIEKANQNIFNDSKDNTHHMKKSGIRVVDKQKKPSIMDNLSLNISSSYASYQDNSGNLKVENIDSSKDQLRDDTLGGTPFSTLEDLSRDSSQITANIVHQRQIGDTHKHKKKKNGIKQKSEKKKAIGEKFDFFSDNFDNQELSKKFKKELKEATIHEKGVQSENQPQKILD